MSPRLRLGVAVGVAVGCAAAAISAAPVAAQSRTCPQPPKPMRFSPQTYVDTERAGGEPTVAMHPDGTLLYAAHAGTTHVYAPQAGDEDSSAFLEHYRGQTYVWRSTDAGASWDFVDRTLPPAGVPGSGFSDPEWAVDAAGNVFESEINLVNVAISKSTDSARSFTLQNAFAQTLTDRQWTAADREDEVYIVGNAFAGGTFPNQPAGNVGHVLYKSTDGGRTFASGVQDDDGLGDLQVNRRDGTLYEANLSDDGTLAMAAFPDARNGDLTRELHRIATGVDMLSHWPAFDIDARGGLYIVWDESGEGGREAGIWFSYSRDGGRSWATPVQVDHGSDGTDIWPWIAVGRHGRVAIAWLEADDSLPDHDAETPGGHGWRVMAAQTLRGLGCRRSPVPGFRTTTATPDPVHKGTICMGGTICQAEGVDRRMGDFFTIEIDRQGRMWAGYSDTRQGGAVSLPGFVRQSGGPPFHRRRAR